MRVKRAHDPLELHSRTLRVEQPVLRGDLLRIGDALLGLLAEWRALAQRTQQELAAEGLQASRERAVVVLGRDRLGGAQAHRAVVQPGGQAHDPNPGLLVTGHQRALHRRRAAPARQQRGMHVDQLVLGEQRLLDQRAEGADDDRARSRGGDQRARFGAVDALRLGQREAELARPLGDRG